MTTRRSQSTEQKHHQRFVLPDPPEREPEDMTSFDHLTLNGSAHHLVQHLGNPETTLVAGERYITREPGAPAEDRMAPDLLVAFNADLQAYRDSNGYIISEQGKPPDFVLEIASRSTGRQDVEKKRPDYAALGIPEYWRFDQTGDFHETWLAGDRLVEGRYEPIPIETVEEGVLQGYSSVLNLLIRWDHEDLGCGLGFKRGGLCVTSQPMSAASQQLCDEFSPYVYATPLRMQQLCKGIDLPNADG